MRVRLIGFVFLFAFSFGLCAEQSLNYTPSKVVYDLSSSDAEFLKNILDRASYLQDIYDNNSFEASIVIIIHEGAIPLFALKNNVAKKKPINELMNRSRSLTMGEIIQFKICAASARMQGYTEKDFADFTSMVPMADAEIVELQQNGYAYLR